MKFQVPQFIATETKLIGPFTLKQFLWLASGGMLIFLLFAVLNRFLFFIVAIPIGMATIKNRKRLRTAKRRKISIPPLASQRNCFKVNGPISLVSVAINCGTWNFIALLIY